MNLLAYFLMNYIALGCSIKIWKAARAAHLNYLKGGSEKGFEMSLINRDLASTGYDGRLVGNDSSLIVQK